MDTKNKDIPKEFCQHGNYITSCSKCGMGYIVGAVRKDDGSFDFSRAARLIENSEEGEYDQEYIYHTGDICSEEMVAHELQEPYTERYVYEFDDAKQEKPYTHYSHAGNIFQILRFGVQSNNFKVHFNELRNGNEEVDKIGREMNGLRNKGASYQAKDGISLSVYDEKLYSLPDRILFLINPEIYTLGEGPEERDVAQGYGHGIPEQLIDGKYSVGNHTAYSTEVIGVNIIHPKEIRAIVVQKGASIMRELHKTLRANVNEYIKRRSRNPETVEDVLADIRLVLDMVGDGAIEEEVDILEHDLPTMSSKQIFARISEVYKRAIKYFVGKTDYTEDDFRNAIRQKFGISILEKS